MLGSTFFFFLIDALKNKIFSDFFSGSASIWAQACMYVLQEGLYYVVQAVVEFIMWPSLVSNSW